MDVVVYRYPHLGVAGTHHSTSDLEGVQHTSQYEISTGPILHDSHHLFDGNDRWFPRHLALAAGHRHEWTRTRDVRPGPIQSVFLYRFGHSLRCYGNLVAGHTQTAIATYTARALRAEVGEVSERAGLRSAVDVSLRA